MDRIYTKKFSLKKLHNLIDKGVFAVPELQREFVWSTRKACELVDSIYRNYPIGTLLIWKTNRRNESQLRKQLHILPPFDSGNRDIYFVIDGQQRLSVLWHFLRGQAGSVTNAEGDEVRFGNVYFDPFAAPSDRRFLYRSRLVGEMHTRLIPVVDLLSPRWRQHIRGHGVRAIRRIEDCRRRIRDYTALLVFCETDNLTEVRESFVRINSLGMRIGTADKAFARASKFNMRAHVREARAQLKNGFDSIRRTTILQTLALALGRRDLGERAIDAMISRLETKESERTRFRRAWPRLREAFAKAADFAVYDLKVPNFGFLPSEPMMTILALFFYYNGNVRPSRAANHKLRRWFWATAVGARYTGRGYRPNLLADAYFVGRLASNARARASLSVRVPIYRLYSTEYGRPGPLSNAFLCLLRLNRPRYLEDGSEVPLGEISSRGNRSDKHHIFPRAVLHRYGIGPDRYNCILNICYLIARENQSIGQQAPRHYIANVPRSGRVRSLAMRSHLIPSQDGRGVWDRSVRRGFNAFLRDRAELLAREFERQAGIQLFERG